MTPPVYLGEPVFDGKNFTRVQPHAEAEMGAWKGYQDWRAAMPNEGKAFSPGPLPFRVGDLFAFDVEPNTRPSKEGDRQIVSNWTRVEEVLDFRSRDAESARRLLVETGLRTMAPGTSQSHVVVALPDGVCVRVRMVKNERGPGFIAGWDELGELATYALNSSVFKGDKFGGRLLSDPGVTVGDQVGVTNWCADAELTEVVLKRLRKVRAAGEPPFRLAQIAPLVSYLERAALLPSLGADLEPLKHRIGILTASLRENTQALEELVDLIAGLKPVETRLREEAERRRAEIENEVRNELEGRVRAEIEARYAEMIEARERLQHELTELEALAGSAREEIAETKAARDELRAALRDELIRLQGELEEPPSSEAATAAELCKRISARLCARGVETELAPLEVPPWARARVRQSETLRDWRAALETIESAAKRWGFSPDEMVLADVAARSGAIVVLPESDAGDFVRAYASAMSCGEMVRHALDPSVLCVDDLWRQPGGRRPTAFANAWAAANLDARRFRIVLLDGVHRTPMDLWLPSFVDVAAGPGWPPNLLLFASLSPHAVDPARAWRGLSSAVTGLIAKRSERVSSQLLAAATGSSVPVSCFDAEAAATPDRSDIRNFMDEYAGKQDPVVLRRITSVLRAAWALAPAAISTQIALAFGDGDGSENRFRPKIIAGLDWLRSVQSSFATSGE
jgi:hypothetical protein